MGFASWIPSCSIFFIASRSRTTTSTSTIKKFPRLNRARGRRRARFCSSPADGGRRRARERSGNSRVLIVLVVAVVLDFLHRRQTEDADEHDLEIPRGRGASRRDA